MDTESLFVCPVCGDGLERRDGKCACPRNHTFDIASAGYVNLLLANRKHSPEPGDDKGMMRARSAFLAKGYYSVLLNELSRLCLDLVPEQNGRVLDSGCGEGYYVLGVWEALAAAGKQTRVGAIDIAKHGVQAGAKRGKASGNGTEFAVASAYELPLAAGSVDVLLSCFSPVALDEFARVVKPGGHIILVQPSARHLWGVKEVLYDEAYENPPNTWEPDRFTRKERREITDEISIDSTGDIMNLFRMTPYYWKTSVEGGRRLAAAQSVKTEIGFIFDLFSRQ